MQEFVYLMASRDGLSIYARLGHPFVFEPYLKLPFLEYAAYRALFEYGGEIQVVSEREYEAWAADRAAKDAKVFFCGDYGGSNKKGDFCGRRVDEPGCRCEHHGGCDAEKQGEYEESGWERPDHVWRTRGH